MARAALREAFSTVGWTTEDLAEDYGEDVLVRIFDAGETTPFSFFVQSKATDQIERFMSKDGTRLAFSIKSEHAKHWVRFWEPVILALYDAKSKQTYWEVIQNFLTSPLRIGTAFRTRKITVEIPADNRLDGQGLARLRNLTRRRFERFELQREGAEVLIETLRELWGVQIIYEPEEGILLLPKGQFVADPSGGRNFTAFGRYAARLEDLEKRFGVKPQSAFEGSLDVMQQVIEGFESGGRLQVRDQDGSVVEEWRTLEELFRYLKRKEELEDD